MVSSWNLYMSASMSCIASSRLMPSGTSIVRRPASVLVKSFRWSMSFAARDATTPSSLSRIMFFSVWIVALSTFCRSLILVRRSPSAASTDWLSARSDIFM